MGPQVFSTPADLYETPPHTHTLPISHTEATAESSSSLTQITMQPYVPRDVLGGDKREDRTGAKVRKSWEETFHPARGKRLVRES